MEDTTLLRTRSNKLTRSIKREVPFAIGSPALIWQVLFFYLPLAIMVVSSVLRISYDGKIEGITLSHFSSLLDLTHLKIAFSSISLASLTVLFSLIIGFPVAYFMAFKAKKYKTLLLFFLIVPFWTNLLLHVCAWFFVLEKNGFLNNLLLSLDLISEPLHFLNSFPATLLLMVYHYIPFMILPIFTSLEKFNPYLLEASSDLGASWFQSFRKVLIPLTLPAIRLGFFFVYIPSFGELVIPELMGGDKTYFVGNVVSQYVLGNATGSLGAAFTVLSAGLLVLSIFFYSWLIKKSARILAGGPKW